MTSDKKLHDGLRERDFTRVVLLADIVKDLTTPG